MIKMNKKNVFSTVRSCWWTMLPYISAVVLGIIAFLIIYGMAPLNVQNDNWIMAEYDENDIIQHYAGWLAFRNSDWSFPIGLANKMAVGDGTVISFTDSIPWIAIFFKLFSNFLPDTFQYFGIYTLFCYIMQGLGAYKVLYYKTRNNKFSLAGTILFCFAPILMERAFRHTALGSQWVILFSIYFYFKHKDKFSYKNYLFFMLLEIFTVGVHPYFLPMVASFSLLCMVVDLMRKRWSSVLLFVGGLAVSYAAGCLIGVLGNGISASRDGFGFYTMNINAVLNPTSCGGYLWSCLFMTHPQTLGNYDGFNYLGAGIVLLLIIVFVLTVCFGSLEKIKLKAKSNIPLAAVCVLLTCFAVSNVVTWNDKILFTIPLPDFLLDLCGIFRASSRLFYPVYYMLYIELLISLWRYKSMIKIMPVIVMTVMVLAVQLYDLHHVIVQKHIGMKEKQNTDSFMEDDILSVIGDTHDEVILHHCWSSNMRSIAVWAFKNDMHTYFSVANSGTYPNSASLERQKRSTIQNEGDLGRTVIISTEEEIMRWYVDNLNVAAYECYGIYFIYVPIAAS